MTKTVKLVSAALAAGTATFALAQTPAASFADTFASMQAESSNSSQFQPSTPVVGSQLGDPVAGLSIPELQALSSEAPAWQIDQGRIPSDAGSRLAQTQPRRLSIDDYQALSSNSGKFESPAEAGSSSLAANDTVNSTGNANKTTLLDRLATLFHRGAPRERAD
jgi:hypothetical protein